MVKKKTDWYMAILWMFVYLAFFFVGFIGGMYFQQMLVSQEVGKILSYSNIDVTVNFNESKLVDELNSRFIPELKETVNQTLIQGGGGNSSQP